MKRLTISLFMTLTSLTIHAQEYGQGLIMDWEELEKIPRKATLMTRDYSSLPKSHSLKKYCPTPDSQGSYGTCTGWATAYAGRTIVEAVRNKWTNTKKITSEAFSPLYVYALIKKGNEKECSTGTSIADALNLMKTEGVVKKRSLDELCVETVKSSLASEAARYKIDDYFSLFGNDHTQAEAVRVTKKALVENCPVLISCHSYKSFHEADDHWNGNKDVSKGYHAMCVVGYDDSKYGGSFLVMNSWGENWGSGGFTWMDYKTYSDNVAMAFELYMKPETSQKTEKAESLNVETKKSTATKNSFSGDVTMQLSTGEKLKATLGTSNGMKHYRINKSLTSGTRYRIYIGNNRPGYLYVFSSDLENNVAVNFPSAGTAAALTYKSNNFALPGEDKWLELDDTIGTDYLCILFSKYSVDVNSLLSHLKSNKGNFYDKVKSGFSKYLASQDDIKYKSGSISFNATTTGAMVPLIVEFTHK